MRSSAAVFLLVAAVALTSASSAETVRERLESMKAANKPEVLLVDHETFTCESCNPPINKARIGTIVKEPGHEEYDNIEVAIRGATKVEVVERRGDRNVRFYTYQVSADGKTLTVSFSDYSVLDKPTKGTYTARRVAAAPAGAHAVSGSWQIQNVTEKPAPAERSASAAGEKSAESEERSAPK
jgi:hypothetical protein